VAAADTDIRVITNKAEYNAFRAETRSGDDGHYRRECNKRHTLADGTVREYHYWRNSKTRKYHPSRKTDPFWMPEIVDVTPEAV